MQNAPFPENQNQNQYVQQGITPPPPPPYYNSQGEYQAPYTQPTQPQNTVYQPYSGSYQPVYYGYPPSYPQFSHKDFPVYGTKEQIQKFYEKKAVKKTANHIGLGLMISFGVQIIISYLLVFFMFFDSAAKIVEDPAFLLIFNIVATFVSFIGAAFFIFKTEKTKPDRLISYGRPKKGTLLAGIMVGIGFCYTANTVVTLLQSRLQGILPFAQSEIELPDGVLGFILSTLAVAVAPALLEEFLFRGAIMGNLLKFGKAFAVFVSAAIFGLIHGNLVQIPFAFLVGLVLGFLVLETKSIWSAVIVHFINNFISVCVDYLGRHIGDDQLNVVYIIMLATFIIVGFFGIYILSLKNKELFGFAKTKHISTSKQMVGWMCSSAAIIVFFVITAIEVIVVQFTA